MAQSKRSLINEELLSGYLDGALPQAEAQKVRVLIEDDPEIRKLYQDLASLREAAASTRFVTPPDEDWPEMPKTRVSWLSRSLGWSVLVIWLTVVSVFALWRFISQSGDALEIFLVLGLPGSVVLLFSSVLIDRIRDLKTDRYRGVQR